jgi:hypothetical protein
MAGIFGIPAILTILGKSIFKGCIPSNCVLLFKCRDNANNEGEANDY